MADTAALMGSTSTSTLNSLLEQSSTLTARFWAKVVPAVGDECWGWNASRNNKGYGVVGFPSKAGKVYAHRVSWEIHYWPIPDGLFVLHRCDNPICCNPRHLFLGTSADNVRDMIEKGRDNGVAPLHRSKTHCFRGHEFTPENTYIAAHNRRQCNECRRIVHRKAYREGARA